MKSRIKKLLQHPHNVESFFKFFKETKTFVIRVSLFFHFIMDYCTVNVLDRL